jgi:hypothetical protein
MNDDLVGRLRARLRKLEALQAGATTPGERDAADAALGRIRARLQSLGQDDPPEEYTFTLKNDWSCRLFCALARRYGLRPYRHARQRYTTVMLMVPQRFVDDTLWPEFLDLEASLIAELDAVAMAAIAAVVHRDASGATEGRG